MATVRRIFRLRGAAVGIGLTILLLAGAALGWHRFSRGSSVQVGDTVIRPHAPIDPNRAYRLVLWEENVVLSGAGTTYQTFLRERVEAFQRNYPNVTVHVELYPPREAANRLEAALASGRPPDVYGSLTPRLVDRTYQIPVDPFVLPPADDGPPPYLPSAWRALTEDGHVWGWPRWVRFTTWAGRRALLADAGLDVDRAVREGWTFQEALTSLAAVGGGRLPGLLLHPGEPDLFRSLMAASGEGPLLERGSLAWSVETMTGVASFLLAARREAHMPSSLDTVARERVARLIQERAGVIAPVRPELAAHLLRTVDPDDLVLLPPPRPEGAPLRVPGETAAYLVFRQSPYAGDAHTRLAMELARFLIQSKDAWVSAQFPAVPAFTEDLPVWRSESPWPQPTGDALLHWAEHAVYPPLDPAEAAVADQMDDQVLAPALGELWGRDDPRAWAEDLHRLLAQQVPEPGG